MRKLISWFFKLLDEVAAQESKIFTLRSLPGTQQHDVVFQDDEGRLHTIPMQMC